MKCYYCLEQLRKYPANWLLVKRDIRQPHLVKVCSFLKNAILKPIGLQPRFYILIFCSYCENPNVFAEESPAIFHEGEMLNKTGYIFKELLMQLLENHLSKI